MREADSWQAVSLALVLPLGLITVLLEWKVAWAAATVLPLWDQLSGYKEEEDFPSGNERHMEGFLQAQTSLTGQATKKFQARQRNFREKQREQQRIFTFTDADNQQTERTRLVSRLTHRDIFWDETNGQRLDFRELLQPTPEPTDSDSELEELPKGLLHNTEAKVTLDRFSRNMTGSVTKFDWGHTNPVKTPNQTTRQKTIPWLEDFRRHEKKHLNSWNILDG